MSVVTRFAPSPTGYLHIGGARTALFNWLYARRHGGRYLLRIEDTDRARSTEAAISAILDGLSWLKLDADEPAIFQFARAPRHREVAEAMVARGTAFRCYVSVSELEARREEGRAKSEAAKDETLSEAARASLKAEAAALLAPFRSPYRDGGLKAPGANAPYVIRLHAPDAGEIVTDDEVQGPVRVAAADIDDLVLLRADGTPTYMLAVVVDDHDMGVTHVIRGDDHLTNTARQIPIYQGMGWEIPVFAHLPMIHGPDGKKLSKRHGAPEVESYRDMGYLPEGVTSYLMRLGWSPGDEEILDLAAAAKRFDLAQVGKSPARIDFDKLASVNAHFMAEAEDGRIAALAEDFGARENGWKLSPEARARLAAAAPILKRRAKTMAELADQAVFAVRERPINLDAAAQKVMKDETISRLRRLAERLSALPSWTEDQLSAAVKAFAAEEGIGLGQIGPALRAVLSGGAPAPDLGQTLVILGRDEALARIGDHT